MTKRKLKYVLAGVLAALVLVLVVQNSHNTPLNFLFWSRSLPTLVVILGPFIIGFFVGRLLSRRR
jgi:uncharacterized integral membrane protein